MCLRAVALTSQKAIKHALIETIDRLVTQLAFRRNSQSERDLRCSDEAAAPLLLLRKGLFGSLLARLIFRRKAAPNMTLDFVWKGLPSFGLGLILSDLRF